jgi:thermitase
MKIIATCSVFLLLSHVGFAQEKIPIPGKILVGFKSDVDPDRAASLFRGHKAKRSKQLGVLPIHEVELEEDADLEQVAKELKNREDVAFAEQDHLLVPEQIAPNDPQYSNQWHLPKIAAPTAWLTTKGSTSVTIAILDSGVDPNHPDLALKLVPGWNTNDNNSSTADVQGHGTRVAGTASALSNNGVGVAGVSWDTFIMPIRVTDSVGFATYGTIAAGLQWAADRGARVANVSFDVTGSATVDTAAAYFRSKGGFVAVSAGNGGVLSSTAASPNLIAVSATDNNDAIYSWSTTGPRVMVSAPGCVTTTYNGGSYGSACGTSFSSPIVAGVAALAISANPALTSAQIRDVMIAAVDDLGSTGWDNIFGHGRINAAKAVAAARALATTTSSTPPPPTGSTTTTADTTAPMISITSPTANSTVFGLVDIRFNTSDNRGVTKVDLFINGRLTASSTTAPFTIQWNTRKVASGTYVLTGRAYDAAGNTTTSTGVTVRR